MSRKYLASPGCSLRRQPEPPSLSEAAWERVEPLLPGARNAMGRPTRNRRRNFEGIRWIAWTRRPWSDPATVRQYYFRLHKAGFIDALIRSLPRNSTLHTHEADLRKNIRQEIEFLRNLTERRPRGCATAKPPA